MKAANLIAILPSFLLTEPKFRQQWCLISLNRSCQPHSSWWRLGWACDPGLAKEIKGKSPGDSGKGFHSR